MSKVNDGVCDEGLFVGDGSGDGVGACVGGTLVGVGLGLGDVDTRGVEDGVGEGVTFTGIGFGSLFLFEFSEPPLMGVHKANSVKSRFDSRVILCWFE